MWLPGSTDFELTRAATVRRTASRLIWKQLLFWENSTLYTTFLFYFVALLRTSVCKWKCDSLLSGNIHTLISLPCQPPHNEICYKYEKQYFEWVCKNFLLFTDYTVYTCLVLFLFKITLSLTVFKKRNKVIKKKTYCAYTVKAIDPICMYIYRYIYMNTSPTLVLSG